ncbi:unnamed protein product [Lupinus luteus]|uniref:Pectinesterase inhibitor domain-containing protein n=1 Tax=Lupinus luteus TaxID=3873 RepID=A0AAV1XVD9_LUPLU
MASITQATILFMTCFILLGHCAKLENTADPKGPAKSAISVTLAEGSKILSYVHELKSANENKKGGILSALSDCDELYTGAIEDLKEASTAVDKGDYETVNRLVSTAMTNSGTCENGFKDLEIPSPLTRQNTHFSQLCSNVLAIIKQ